MTSDPALATIRRISDGDRAREPYQTAAAKRAAGLLASSYHPDVIRQVTDMIEELVISHEVERNQWQREINRLTNEAELAQATVCPDPSLCAWVGEVANGDNQV